MDLTKITTPFGLLDEATQEALKAHGGPYECFAVANGAGWKDGDVFGNDLDGFPAIAWRVKPAPPKPREFWIVNECEAYASRAEAGEALIGLTPPHRIIHVREVLE